MPDPADLLASRARERLGLVLRGKYRLERLLGVGGTSAVYEAVHRNGNRVALKMLHPHVSLNGEVRRRFLQEGYAANNVGHPGVVRVLDDDTAEDGSTFVVMELLSGETLGARAERSGGILRDALVMQVACQLLDVLAAAHERGVIHRDIKPDNVFVTTSGAVKLLDFGLARVLDDADSATATMSGQVFGTPAFMPPEQALGRKQEIDARSDLWSVGATLFTLLSGKLVHEAETTNELLVYAASRPARPLSSVAPSVPAPVAAIVDRALRFAKGERWSSASAMRAAVAGVLVTVYHTAPPAPASVVAPAAGEAPRLGSGRRRSRVLYLGLGAAGLVIVGGIFLVRALLGSSGSGSSEALDGGPVDGASSTVVSAPAAAGASSSGSSSDSAVPAVVAPPPTGAAAEPGSTGKPPAGVPAKGKPQRPPAGRGAFEYQ